jgi:hypothetical protein
VQYSVDLDICSYVVGGAASGGHGRQHLNFSGLLRFGVHPTYYTLFFCIRAPGDCALRFPGRDDTGLDLEEPAVASLPFAANFAAFYGSSPASILENRGFSWKNSLYILHIRTKQSCPFSTCAGSAFEEQNCAFLLALCASIRLHFHRGMPLSICTIATLAQL